MHQSVQDVFFDFSKQFEGALHFMYLDILNLVTTGVGNLIDPISLALPLPWSDKDTGAPADAATITAEWNTVKSRSDLSPRGGAIFETITRLRLSDAAVDNLVRGKLSQNEVILMQTPEFSNLANWPADAQLGLFSLAWAMGPAFAQANRWPNFRNACAAEDFARAATHSRMSEAGNRGLIPRNQANEMLFHFASRSQALGLPLDDLIYPRILTSGGIILDMALPSIGARWPTLRLNNSGQPVAVLQTLLFGDGSPAVTGQFDGATDQAVRAFQSASTDRDGNPLVADGIVGGNTWHALVLAN